MQTHSREVWNNRVDDEGLSRSVLAVELCEQPDNSPASVRWVVVSECKNEGMPNLLCNLGRCEGWKNEELYDYAVSESGHCSQFSTSNKWRAIPFPPAEIYAVIGGKVVKTSRSQLNLAINSQSLGCWGYGWTGVHNVLLASQSEPTLKWLCRSFVPSTKAIFRMCGINGTMRPREWTQSPSLVRYVRQSSAG